MAQEKFITIPVFNDFKTVNVRNIALLEKDGTQSIVTLNITDDDGKFIKFWSIQTFDQLNQQIYLAK